MFDIGWTELLVIGVVALIAIGPKELPGVLRAVGHWMGKIRRMAAEFQGQFQEAMREAEMAELKKQVDEMADATQNLADYDPVADVTREIDNINREVADALERKPVETAAEAPPSEPAPAAASEPAVAAPHPAGAEEPGRPTGGDRT